MAPDGDSSGSALLMEECFASGDPAFLGELRKVTDAPKLQAFVERWKKDPRPWAREQIFAYLDEPLDRPGHQVVVKRLFKHFEQQGDTELVGAFLVAFDRLVFRDLEQVWRYDGNRGRSYEVTRLRAGPRALPREINMPAAADLADWHRENLRRTVTPESRLFTMPTRHYLRRRAWRTFRRLGFRQPEAYVPAVADMLARYRDEDFDGDAGLIDAWGFLQALFRHSDLLEFGRDHVSLRPDLSLRDLAPAPRLPRHWQSEDGYEALLRLVLGAGSRTVRVVAIRLLEEHHRAALVRLPVDRLRALLAHEDEKVAHFAAGIFGDLEAIDRLTLDEWFVLLEVQDPTVLGLICEAMAKRVSPDRLSLADRARLACAEAVPVARLGLSLLKEADAARPEDRPTLLALAGARCAAVGEEIARYAIERLGTPEHYTAGEMIEFFDATLPEIRAAAMSWLLASDDSPGARDPALVARLVETPYDDVRLRLIDWLDRRAKLPGANARDLVPVWTSVLLGVHRGGRRKQAALRQLTSAIETAPDLAPDLLPVIAVAVRSVRGPERGAGLAAVARLMTVVPELEGLIETTLPDVRFPVEEARP